MISAFIPSPDQGTWQIGFFELRAYALCIIAGVLVAVWLGNRRWVARGGRPGTVADVAVWAVPFGLVGARLYHVATDWQLYFCSTCEPVQALYIWRGGLGIWGAISLGALGAWIGCRRRGISFAAFGDALVPAIAVAQGIGRFGNWFNQELFGKPTTVPWALEIDRGFRPDGYEQFATFHPTFAYEALWDFGIAGLLVWADRRFRLGHGRVVALYIMAYTAGRGWIEMLRIDEANHILGLRLNVWTSILLFLFGLVLFVWSARRHPGREDPSALGGPAPEPATEPAAEPATEAVTESATVGAAGSTATGGSTDGAHSDPDVRSAEPDPAEPEGAEPEGAEPEGAEPEGAEPEGAEPEVAEGDAEQPAPAGAREAGSEEPVAGEPAAEEPAAEEPAAEEPAAEEPAAEEPQAEQAQAQEPTDAAPASTTPSTTATKPRRRWRLRRRR